MVHELCPFCGSDNTSTHQDMEVAGKWGYAMCGTCGARGPEVRTGYDESLTAPWRDEAVGLWNQRISK